MLVTIGAGYAQIGDSHYAQEILSTALEVARGENLLLAAIAAAQLEAVIGRGRLTPLAKALPGVY